MRGTYAQGGGREIYYYANEQECDFVVREGGKVVNVLQVAVSVEDDDTRQREIRGLTTAMEHFGLDSGTIVTLEEEEDLTTADNLSIHIHPVYKWLLSK